MTLFIYKLFLHKITDLIAKDNPGIIANKLRIWDDILKAKRLKIAGARKVYELAPEIYHEPNRNL